MRTFQIELDNKFYMKDKTLNLPHFDKAKLNAPNESIVSTMDSSQSRIRGSPTLRHKRWNLVVVAVSVATTMPYVGMNQ